MALELVKIVTEVGVGVVDGLLDPPPTGGIGLPPLVLGDPTTGTKISYGAIAEAGALVVGAGMQLMMPFTLPDVADGLFDAGLPLLAARLTRHFTNKAGGLSGGVGGVVAPYGAAPRYVPAVGMPGVTPMPVAPWAGARSSVGSIQGLNKLVLR